MKRKINLTIDTELYDAFENLPRKVSVSEIVNFVMRILMMQAAKGRELTQEEFAVELEKAGGEEFRQRVTLALGPTVEKIDLGLGKIRELFTLSAAEEPETAK